MVGQGAPASVVDRVTVAEPAAGPGSAPTASVGAHSGSSRSESVSPGAGRARKATAATRPMVCAVATIHTPVVERIASPRLAPAPPNESSSGPSPGLS